MFYSVYLWEYQMDFFLILFAKYKRFWKCVFFLNLWSWPFLNKWGKGNQVLGFKHQTIFNFCNKKKKFKGFCSSSPLFTLIIMKPQTAFSSPSAGINFYSSNKVHAITAIHRDSLPVSLTVLLQGREIIFK